MKRLSWLLLLSSALVGCSSKTPTPQILNTGANLSLASLPQNPLAWRVLTSGVNRQQHSIFTLYGNDAAVDHARAYDSSPYPDGAQIALVTWSQKEDPHWFGGFIPGSPQSVEFVSFSNGTQVYSRFSGASLAANAVDASAQQQRTGYMLSLKPALMP